MLINKRICIIFSVKTAFIHILVTALLYILQLHPLPFSFHPLCIRLVPHQFAIFLLYICYIFSSFIHFLLVSIPFASVWSPTNGARPLREIKSVRLWSKVHTAAILVGQLLHKWTHICACAYNIFSTVWLYVFKRNLLACKNLFTIVTRC